MQKDSGDSSGPVKYFILHRGKYNISLDQKSLHYPSAL